jgi:hypothetical protein
LPCFSLVLLPVPLIAVLLVVARRTVLLVVQVLGLLPGLRVSLISVQVTEEVTFEVLVDLSGGEAGEQLFRHRVVHRLAVGLAVLLVHPHGLEAGCARDQLVGYMVTWMIWVVELLVSALRAELVEEVHWFSSLRLAPAPGGEPGAGERGYWSTR